ncbi:MAG TPA: glycosyltransferase family A protein [Pyrinomonadaceae bacterium]|jgi:glycosyltransferase involved in cell wall biosynthesis
MIGALAKTERLIASSIALDVRSPFLTVAIPHYKHRRYLEVVLASIFEQTFDDFEILVSDDCSPDDSNTVIPRLLEASGRSYSYYAQASNLGYDGNVRFCLRAARGHYVLLLGNDDALSGPVALIEMVQLLHELGLPEVAFTNYEDWESGEVMRRAFSTRLLGSGPAVAATHFRSFSFVSGLVYSQTEAVRHETARWDSSVYYQIYLACRILSAGGSLGALDLSVVRKDVKVDGEHVPNYVSRWADAPWSWEARHTGLDSVIRVTADAVLPLVPEAERSRTLRRIVAKALMVTYPFWLFEYRRTSNWSFSFGVARGMWPGNLLAEYRLALVDRSYLWLLYLSTTMAGLFTPAAIFNSIKHRLADSVRRLQQSEKTTAHAK